VLVACVGERSERIQVDEKQHKENPNAGESNTHRIPRRRRQALYLDCTCHCFAGLRASFANDRQTSTDGRHQDLLVGHVPSVTAIRRSRRRRRRTPTMSNTPAGSVAAMAPSRTGRIRRSPPATRAKTDGTKPRLIGAGGCFGPDFAFDEVVRGAAATVGLAKTRPVPSLSVGREDK